MDSGYSMYRNAKTLIWLRGCAAWSESSLFILIYGMFIPPASSWLEFDTFVFGFGLFTTDVVKVVTGLQKIGSTPIFGETAKKISIFCFISFLLISSILALTVLPLFFVILFLDLLHLSCSFNL